MDMKECECDIAEVLQNTDFTVLQNLRLTSHKFRMTVASKLKDAAAYATECTKKNNVIAEKVLTLQQEIEALKPSVDNTKLQQKIVDKKIANAMKKEDVLKKELEDARIRRDNLSLELVDLQQDVDERKKEKKQKWEAYKRACYAYKQNVDMDIKIIDMSDVDSYEKIKVIFFVRNGTTENNNYYVNLLHNNDVWKVEEIKPMLEEKHMNSLKNLVQFPGDSVISDVTAFLCEIRYLFLKYYTKSR